MMDAFIQIMIFMLGVSAIFLVGYTDKNIRKWAYVFGLLSQPFWFYMAWDAQQWGVFAMSFFYALSWARGFFNHWFAEGA